MISVMENGYWTILKLFINGKKIPSIPPILHEDKFVTNFQIRSEIFNFHFAKQCSLLKNQSRIPLSSCYIRIRV